MTETFNEVKGKAPIQEVPNQNTKIKIWEAGKEGENFPVASMDKFFKKDGEFKNGYNFSIYEMKKIHEKMPEAIQQMEKWQQYYDQTQGHEKQVQGNGHEQVSNRDQVLAQMPNTQTQEVAPEHDMMAARDAVMEQAQEPDQSQVQTQDHYQNQPRTPSR